MVAFSLALISLFRFSESVPGFEAAKKSCYNAGMNAAKNIKIDVSGLNIDWSKFNFN